MKKNQAINEDRKEDRETGGIQVIFRVGNILRVLREHPEGLNPSQLAKEVKLPRSTVHRIISALESERLIDLNPSNGHIRLGLGLVSLAAAVDSDLRRELRPFLEQLYLAVDETIDLAVLSGEQLLFVDQVAAPHRLRAVSGIGMTFPLYCTANGKAMLAALPREQIERILPQELPSFTQRTITDRARLLEEIEQIRTELVAFDREEHTLGICAVGVAIQRPGGRLAAISIPAPSIRFYGNEQKLATALLETHKLIGNLY
jgi:DNA-binding IclR family transcriptional regulator